MLRALLLRLWFVFRKPKSFQQPPSLRVSLTYSGLHVDPGESVGSSRGDEGLGRVEGHVVNGLFALLTVSRDLLDAGFTVQVPQTQGAVVTWGGGGEVPGFTDKLWPWEIKL